MKKNNKFLLSLVFVGAYTQAIAGAYKIPYVSTNSIAKAGANVAFTNSVDAAYLNPANMIYLEDKSMFEAGFSLVHLDNTNFDNNTTSISSKTQDKPVPNFHYVSKNINDFRFGLSVVSPVGLAIKWYDAPATIFATKSELLSVEINPSVAYKVSQNFSIAAGISALYSEVQLTAGVPGTLYQEIDANSIDFGYNLAMTYKPMKDITMSATYRSKINMTLDGDAKVDVGAIINSSVKATLPIPATLNLATAFNLNENTIIEFAYEKTFWNVLKNQDLDYSNTAVESSPFGLPVVKNWENTNSYRIGLTHNYEKWVAMLGFAKEENPIPSSTLHYDLPDADAWVYSIGGKYNYSSNIDLNFAALYFDKESRSFTNTAFGTSGTFSGSDAIMIGTSLTYKF